MHRLADRTRELIDELEAGRPDVLSPVDLNRALKQLLRTQAVILRALAGGAGELASAAFAREAARPAEPQEPAGAIEPPRGPTIRATPRPTSTSAPRPESPRPESQVTPPGAAPLATPTLNGNGHHHHVHRTGTWSAPQADDDAEELEEPEVVADAPERSEPSTGAASSGSHEGGPATAPAPGTVAELFAAVKSLPGMIARTLVELFDNRDKDYTKGLEKLNRWVDGGAGTPFQLRGDRAFLNARAAGAPAMRNYEEQLMTRMGFSLRLGRLVVPGFIGDVIVYERPS